MEQYIIVLILVVIAIFLSWRAYQNYLREKEQRLLLEKQREEENTRKKAERRAKIEFITDSIKKMWILNDNNEQRIKYDAWEQNVHRFLRATYESLDDFAARFIGERNIFNGSKFMEAVHKELYSLEKERRADARLEMQQELMMDMEIMQDEARLESKGSLGKSSSFQSKMYRFRVTEKGTTNSFFEYVQAENDSQARMTMQNRYNPDRYNWIMFS